MHDSIPSSEKNIQCPESSAHTALALLKSEDAKNSTKKSDGCDLNFKRIQNTHAFLNTYHISQEFSQTGQLDAIKVYTKDSSLYHGVWPQTSLQFVPNRHPSVNLVLAVVYGSCGLDCRNHALSMHTHNHQLLDTRMIGFAQNPWTRLQRILSLFTAQ